jgi:ABC-type multidrug transport system fused ATPase/permease subunit
LFDVLRYIKVFQIYLGYGMYWVFAVSTIAAFLEGLGILMFLPLLKQLGGSNDNNISDDYITKLLEGFFANQPVGVIVGVIICIFSIKGMLILGSRSLSALYKTRLLYKLKTSYFSNYNKINYSSFTDFSAGHVVNVMNEQINRSGVTFNAAMLLFAQIVNLLFYLIFSLIVAWNFALMSIFFGVIIFLLFRWLNAYLRVISIKTTKENGKLATLMIQSIHAFKYINSTNQFSILKRHVDKTLIKLTSYEFKRGVADGLMAAIREPVVVITVILIIYLATKYNNSEIENILVSIVLFYKTIISVFIVQTTLQSIVNTSGSMDILESEEKFLTSNKEINGSEKSGNFKDIKFKNVCFDYKNKQVLKNINFEIQANKTIAFVGPSGSGKSTIVDLITLMLHPKSGSIEIDGVLSKDLDFSSWRGKIGFVSQDSTMFDDTIYNNISMWGNIDDNTLYRVKTAAKMANISDFIESLPEGYMSQIGDRGANISGGQRQRLFIAREIFRNSNFLILDEATSALDSVSESKIQKTIKKLKEQNTIILISHNISTISSADYVYVLEDGAIVESGSFNMLKNNASSIFCKYMRKQEH